MKKKQVSFMLLLLACSFFLFFIFGIKSSTGVKLLIVFLILLFAYALSPDEVIPEKKGERRGVAAGLIENGRLNDPQKLPEPDPQDKMLSVWIQYCLKRFREEAAYRRKITAQAAVAMLILVGILTLINKDVILWRAVLVMAVCALGLLTLAILALIRRRRKKATDHAVHPQPKVNMTYDHDAAADSRVRALQQRLERLEEWRRGGLIDEKEYEELRKKYLKQ